MTQEDQKAFEDLFSLFIQEGWGVFLSDLDMKAGVIEQNILYSSLSEADYNFSKGQLNVLKFIKSYKDSAEISYENLTAEPEEVQQG